MKVKKKKISKNPKAFGLKKISKRRRRLKEAPTMAKYMGGGKSPMKMPGGGMTPEKKNSKFVARDLLQALEGFESGRLEALDSGRGMSSKDQRDLLKQLVLMARSRRKGFGPPRRDVMKKGGKFPDLNKDGKVTMADILMGRGVKKGKK